MEMETFASQHTVIPIFCFNQVLPYKATVDLIEWFLQNKSDEYQSDKQWLEVENFQVGNLKKTDIKKSDTASWHCFAKIQKFRRRLENHFLWCCTKLELILFL